MKRARLHEASFHQNRGTNLEKSRWVKWGREGNWDNYNVNYEESNVPWSSLSSYVDKVWDIFLGPIEERMHQLVLLKLFAAIFHEDNTWMKEDNRREVNYDESKVPSRRCVAIKLQLQRFYVCGALTTFSWKEGKRERESETKWEFNYDES